MNILTSSLEGLSGEERHLALDDLVQNGLTKYELRRLWPYFDPSGPGFRKDICLDVPMEILLLIVNLLDLSEIITASQVSRSWRERFFSPEMCISLTKRYFKAEWATKWEEVVERGGTSSEILEDSKLQLRNWLRPAAAARALRLCNKHQSSAVYHFSLQPAFHEVLYQSGRFAHSIYRGPGPPQFIQGYQVTVYNLESGSMQAFRNRHQANMRLLLLTNKVLVVKEHDGVRPQYRAWNLDESPSDPPLGYQITLPSQSSAEHVSGFGNQVGFISNQGQIHIWQIASAVKEIHNPLINETQRYKNGNTISNFALHFDHAREGCFFAFSIHCEGYGNALAISPAETAWICAQKFVNNKADAYYTSFDIPEKVQTYADSPEKLSFRVISPVDQHGILMLIPYDTQSNVRSWYGFTSNQDVFFDPYREEFSFLPRQALLGADAYMQRIQEVASLAKLDMEDSDFKLSHFNPTDLKVIVFSFKKGVTPPGRAKHII